MIRTLALVALTQAFQAPSRRCQLRARRQATDGDELARLREEIKELEDSLEKDKQEQRKAAPVVVESKPVEKKEPGDRLAEVLDVIRNAKYESISRNQGRDDLAMRLAAAEQENEKLTEEVKKLEVINEKAAQELLKDAEELAFMSMRLENLEKEAEALKDLNVKLVEAADQLAVMVGNDGVASTTATHLDHDLTALRMEADSAKDALATAEARAAAERSDLIARIRTLEIDLAEAEGEAEEAADKPPAAAEADGGAPLPPPPAPKPTSALAKSIAEGW